MIKENKIKKLLVIIIILMIAGPAIAGQLTVGLSKIPSAHSESDSDRCLNDGYAVDAGWIWKPLTFNLNKYFGIEIGAGVLGTYSNIESAYRKTVKSPESKQKRESSLTILGMLKPTIRIWKFKPYFFLGAGPDFSTTEGTDFGYLKKGKGIDFELTNTITIGVSDRKYYRSGTFYRYQTATLNISF